MGFNAMQPGKIKKGDLLFLTVSISNERPNLWRFLQASLSDDDQVVRGTLGRLLFSGDDVKKKVKVLSGGEQGRLLFGKLMLTRPNVLLMDEPTNHMDMDL